MCLCSTMRDEGMRLMLIGLEGPPHEKTSHQYQYSATQSRKQ